MCDVPVPVTSGDLSDSEVRIAARIGTILPNQTKHTAHLEHTNFESPDHKKAGIYNQYFQFGGQCYPKRRCLKISEGSGGYM